MEGQSMNIGSSENVEVNHTENKKHILYRNKSTVKVGELNRYIITYRPAEQKNDQKLPSSLWLKVKNMEALPLRAAYLAGPYILYVDVRPEDYDQNVRSFTTGSQPVYESQLKANQSFYAELFMNKVKTVYTWTVDVVSQIIFSTGASIQFELLLGHSKDDLHGNLHTAVPASIEGGLRVQKYDTLDIWHSPTPRHDSPLHLVVVTHGLHSNTGVDMLYLKEKIDEMAKKTGENVIVRGYFDNVCRTERGIKYLGRRLGDYVLKELAPVDPPKGSPPVSKISFIAHSLGGLIQSFAIAHIQSFEPDFFKRIEPVNFITLATPFLGISNENPGYVKFALDIGFAGKTGQDLGLTWKPSTKKGHKPLLQVLPTGPTHEALKLFRDRTLYANAVNDGIVPLRTSAILYLDWKALFKAARVKRGEGNQSPAHKGDSSKGRPYISKNDGDNAEESDGSDDSSDNEEDRETGEIPEDVGTANKDQQHPQQNSNGNNEKDSKSKSPGDILSSVTGPFNSLFSFLAPQAGGKRPGKIYQRSQTMRESESDSEEEKPQEYKEGHLPKKTSMLESGVSVLLPPLPPQSFIVDPDTRPATIFHDRVYKESDLPPKVFKKASTTFNLGKQMSFSSSSSSSPASSPVDHTAKSNTASDGSKLVEKSKVEERIAREWHKGTTWRKVLVQLEPDAHNNIIVRRRFANAFGWPVIDHLVENHFGTSSTTLGKMKDVSSEDLAAEVPYDIRKHLVANPEDIKRSSSNITPVDIIRRSSDRNREKTPPQDPESLSQDLSSLMIDTSVPDEPVPRDVPKEQRSASSTHHQPMSATSNSSLNAAWDMHLRSQDDSEDDGFVHSVGSWIDNIRNIGNITNYAGEPQPDSSNNSNNRNSDRYHVLEPTIEEDIEGLPTKF
ncbi:hypothetical protein TRICI_001290 [Trichomonascus ciferrii]|uniref:DUF676 domain-containing protein n=1 Tax=Trichomonascus ciferrii TaxID=44093 RepID=A0A642VCP5_9ASCO|nr:hypothetical protein TRICI_001290 [Trichomonascus ciferrii]